MRTLAFLLPLLVAAPAFAQDGSVAVRAGTVMLPDGSTLENGTVVVQGGRITAVGGADLEIPFDVVLHEFPEGVVFAGFHEAHTSDGLDRANESVPIAPFLHVRDSIDPVSFYFEDELRNGTVAIGIIPGNDTVLGGSGVVVAPYGMTVEQMTVHAPMGQKLAIGPQRGWSRASQLAELREAVAKLHADLRVLGQAKLDGDAADEDQRRIAGEDATDEEDHDQPVVRFGDDFPGKDALRAADLDDAQLGLVRVLNGDERLWVWAPTATDVQHARLWLDEHGLTGNSVLVVTAAAWKAADVIAEMDCPVALIGGLWDVERDPVTRKEERHFAPLAFHEAGVIFSVGSEKGRMGPDRLGYQTAVMIREGVPRAAALAAVTAVPAMLWGADGKLGVLEEGADGTFVVLDGDPLAAESRVLHVWLRGEHAYDRSQDERLQRLLEGENE